MDKTNLSGNASGMWYPRDEEALKDFLDDKMKKIIPLKDRKIKAMILPHAGYQFSAENALYALSGLRGKESEYSKIIVMGPAHQATFFNQFLVPKANSYQTPFGELEIDHKAILDLKENFGQLIKEDDELFKTEHSIDNEIPLIHYALGPKNIKQQKIKILPLMVSHFDEQHLRQMTEAIKSIIDKKTLLIVSSDFTHHGKNFQYTPFENASSGKELEEKLMKLDLTAGEFARLGQGKEFIDFVSLTKATICGVFPIYLLLEILPPSLEGEIVKYDTSARLTDGNFDHSVSYLSLIYSGEWQPQEEITHKDKKEILKIARLSLEKAILERKILSKTLIDHVPPLLREKRAAFVTLKIDRELRGCIGEIIPTRPLIDVIIERAIDAGVNDTRFNPVTSNELKKIDIEVTILTPPKDIASIKEITLGKHGIILIKEGKSAVFLPQVPIEEGFDLPTTLNHLAIKAGLPEKAWQNNARFQVFEGVSFSESRVQL